MVNDPIAMANDRLAAIRMEIGSLQAEQREIENALAVLRRFGASDQAPPSVAAPIHPEVAKTVEAGARNGTAQGFQMSQAEFEVLATRAIEEAGRPMTRTQLLRWLEHNGTPMLGGDPSKNVGTKLWRARDRFINLRGSGYWFHGRACEAVGYDPTKPRSASDFLDDLIDDAEHEREAMASGNR